MSDNLLTVNGANPGDHIYPNLYSRQPSQNSITNSNIYGTVTIGDSVLSPGIQPAKGGLRPIITYANGTVVWEGEVVPTTTDKKGNDVTRLKAVNIATRRLHEGLEGLFA